ncbi:MAG: hypothetical protein WKF97_23745 [Chitinophagaceae bacterium]
MIISETEPRGDLTDALAQALKLKKNGEHVVHEDNGRKLIANVSNGVIVDWTAFDKDGSEVATVVVRQPAQNPRILVPRGARWAIVCACFASGDICWWQPY